MQAENRTKAFIRGGQMLLQNYRMFAQIGSHLLAVAVILFVLVSGTAFYFRSTAYERYFSLQYGWSLLIPVFDEQAVTEFMQPDHEISHVRYTALRDSLLAEKIMRAVSRKLIHAMWMGLLFSLVFLYLAARFLRRHGEKQTLNQQVSGDRIVSRDELGRHVLEQNREIRKKDETSSIHPHQITLAGLPMVAGSEAVHFLFHGSTGTGKSTAIRELLDHVRARGERAIIYDKSCSFVEEFFEPDRDILLNPLDGRSPAWDLWAECRDESDFVSLAASLIPLSSGASDPFWITAARLVLSSILYRMRHEKDRSVSRMMEILFSPEMKIIQDYLAGTEAAAIMSEKIEKTAMSIQSVIAAALRSLKFLPEPQENRQAFSIRRWVNAPERKTGWLFVSSLSDRHETLKPLITAWLDIALDSVMSPEPCGRPSIWIILDELASLHQLPYLTNALAEARKFGGCMVVGLQNIAQLGRLYGTDGARAISSLLNTRFLFRQPDPDMARWSASNFGETVVSEVREGMSYGASTLQDGISVNRIETRKSLISYSEMMSLPNLAAYVRLPGDFPVTRVQFEWKKRVRKNEGMLLRAMEDTEEKQTSLPEKKEVPVRKKQQQKRMMDKKVSRKSIAMDME